jgi:hypothetical protein
MRGSGSENTAILKEVQKRCQKRFKVMSLHPNIVIDVSFMHGDTSNHIEYSSLQHYSALPIFTSFLSHEVSFCARERALLWQEKIGPAPSMSDHVAVPEQAGPVKPKGGSSGLRRDRRHCPPVVATRPASD